MTSKINFDIVMAGLRCKMPDIHKIIFISNTYCVYDMHWLPYNMYHETLYVPLSSDYLIDNNRVLAENNG